MRQACSGEKQQFFFQHRLADGAIREVEIFTGPIMVKGKKLLYSIVHDITERRRLEAEVAMKAQLLDLSDGLHLCRWTRRGLFNMSTKRPTRHGGIPGRNSSNSSSQTWTPRTRPI